MKRWTILIMAAAIASSVAFSALPVNAAEQKLEAESMNWKSGNYDNMYDRTASGNYKRVWWTDGAAEGTLKSSGDFSKINVVAKGNLYGRQLPKAHITVDGTYAGTIKLDTESWKTYSVTGDWSAGDHTVKIKYVNDQNYTYRNYIVDYVVAANVRTSVPDPEPTPPTAGECDTQGSGEMFTNRNYQSFTDAGKTSKYHLYASGLPADKPLGLLVQLHGDGASEFSRPNNGKLAGMKNVARDHDMVMIAAKTPDNWTETWWQDGRKNAKWLQALIDQVAYEGYDIDKSKVWFSGYSGGAEFLSYYYIDMMSDTFCGGGALISGGGGANNGTPGTIPASNDFKQNFRMHWYSGKNDTSGNASDGFCGYCAAQEGSAFYQNQGFSKVTTEYPAEVNHYQLDEVRVLREQLNAAYPNGN